MLYKSFILQQFQGTSADFYCMKRLRSHLSLSLPSFVFPCPLIPSLCLSLSPPLAPPVLCVPVGFLQQLSCSSVSMRGDDLWASTPEQLAKRNSEWREGYSRETGGDKEVETEERRSGVTKEKTEKGGKWWRSQMMLSQR